jgi:hypothetical protein
MRQHARNCVRREDRIVQPPQQPERAYASLSELEVKLLDGILISERFVYARLDFVWLKRNEATVFGAYLVEMRQAIKLVSVGLVKPPYSFQSVLWGWK